MEFSLTGPAWSSFSSFRRFVRLTAVAGAVVIGALVIYRSSDAFSSEWLLPEAGVAIGLVLFAGWAAWFLLKPPPVGLRIDAQSVQLRFRGRLNVEINRRQAAQWLELQVRDKPDQGEPGEASTDASHYVRYKLLLFPVTRDAWEGLERWFLNIGYVPVEHAGGSAGRGWKAIRFHPP